MDTLFRPGDEDDTVFVVGFDAEGRAHGLLHFGVSKAGSALSLSSMPRDWESRFLVCERPRDLPRIGLAALAVEAYLPFQ